MKKRTLLISLALLLSISLVDTGYPAPEQVEPPPRDRIVIGQAVSLSGPFAGGVAVSSGPVYEMWVANVNARGGIYVAEYGRRLPVELLQFDDKSDMGTMIRLLEKLILEHQVDFLLPPWGTAFLYVAAPIANKHGYILIGGAGGTLKLQQIMADLPFFFSPLNVADTQMPVLADILVELGVNTVAMIYIANLHGIEYTGVLVPELERRGIDIKMLESYPPGIKDLSPLLRRAAALDVDAFIGFTYPPCSMLVTSQAMELGLNFKVFHLSVGPLFPFYRDAFGADVVEGIMGTGAWNKKSSPGAKEFREMFIEFHGQEPDHWGSLIFYASLQAFEQAIEKAGTLDQAKIRDIMAMETFDTFLGPFYYGEDRIFRGHLGQIGQWQDGVFEVIGPQENRTAAPIFKPDWP